MQRSDITKVQKDEDFDEMLDSLIEKTAQCSIAARSIEDSVFQTIMGLSQKEEEEGDNADENAEGNDFLKLNSTIDVMSNYGRGTKASLQLDESDLNETYITALLYEADSSSKSNRQLVFGDNDETSDDESDEMTVKRESPSDLIKETICQDVAEKDMLKSEAEFSQQEQCGDTFVISDEEEGACALPLDQKAVYAAAEEELDSMAKAIDAYSKLQLQSKQNMATSPCSILSTSEKSSVPKLIFFDERGSAEALRFLLAYGKITYHDVRINHVEWQELKKCKPICQLPMLIVGDTIVQHIVPIARYLGSLGGIAGSTPLEAMKIDAIIEEIEEFRIELLKAYVNYEINQGAARMRNLQNEKVHIQMNLLEQSVIENEGYLALKNLTWADVFFAGVIEYFSFINNFDIFDGYRALSRNVEMVRRQNGIRQWIKMRPQTDV